MIGNTVFHHYEAFTSRTQKNHSNKIFHLPAT